MGAIKDRSRMGLAEAKTYAKDQNQECGAGDLVLSLILEAAKERADYICQNPFCLEDEDGEYVLDENGNRIPQPIPIEVELWILRKFVKNSRFRMVGNNDENQFDIGSVKMDNEDWRELGSYIKYS